MNKYLALVQITELATLLTAVFTAFGALLYGFYKYAQAREKDFEASRLIAAKEYDKSTKRLTQALDRVALASERAADEAKDRNGHLAELIIQAQENILSMNQNINEQKVEHQHVVSTETE
jgi:Flp pilus assembly protein TadB